MWNNLITGPLFCQQIQFLPSYLLHSSASHYDNLRTPWYKQPQFIPLPFPLWRPAWISCYWEQFSSSWGPYKVEADKAASSVSLITGGIEWLQIRLTLLLYRGHALIPRPDSLTFMSQLYHIHVHLLCLCCDSIRWFTSVWISPY